MKSQSNKKDKPIKKKEEVKKNPDKHIDQDFPGYPDAPSRETMIKPVTEKDKTNARLKEKDKKPYKAESVQGEGVQQKSIPADEVDEQSSDGSAGAFEGTEKVEDDE